MNIQEHVKDLRQLLLELLLVPKEKDASWPSAQSVYDAAHLWAVCRFSTFRNYYSALIAENVKAGQDQEPATKYRSRSTSSGGRPSKALSLLSFLDSVKQKVELRTFNTDEIIETFNEVLTLGSRSDRTSTLNAPSCVISEDKLRLGYATVYSFIPVDSLPLDTQDVIATLAAHFISFNAQFDASGWHNLTHMVLLTDVNGISDYAPSWIAFFHEKYQKERRQNSSQVRVEYSLATFAQAVNSLCQPKSLFPRLGEGVAGDRLREHLVAIPAHVSNPNKNIVDVADWFSDQLVSSPWVDQNILITGSFGSGKTTLLINTVEALNLRINDSEGESRHRFHSNHMVIVLRASNLRQNPAEKETHDYVKGFLQEALHDSMGFSLSLKTLKSLSKYVSPIILIDGLDEARGIHKLRGWQKRVHSIQHLNGWFRGMFPNATLVISARPEVLMSVTALESAFPVSQWLHIELGVPVTANASGWLRAYSPQAYQLYEQLKVNYFETDTDETFLHPLALRFLSKLEPDVIKAILSRDAVLPGYAELRCLEQYVRAWSHYELMKGAFLSTEIDVPKREWWVERLALLNTELIIEFGRDSQKIKQPLEQLETLVKMIDTYEMSDRRESLGPDELRILMDAIAVSMFLVLKDDTVTFANNAIRQFLAARYLFRLFDSSAEENERHRVRSKLGRINLNKEQSIARMMIQRLADDRGIDYCKIVEDIEFEIQHVASATNGYSPWAPFRHLKSNLLLLLALALEHSNYPKSVRFTKKDFCWVVPPDAVSLQQVLKRFLVLDSCNLEGSGDFSKRCARISNCLVQTTEIIESHRNFISGAESQISSWLIPNVKGRWTVKCGLVSRSGVLKRSSKKGIPQQCLEDLVLVPGGECDFMTHQSSVGLSESSVHRDSFGLLSRRRLEGPLRRGFVPSFLMQKNPVSNAQFAYFVTINKEYEKRQRRDQLGNAYYLAGWDHYGEYKPFMDKFLELLEEEVEKEKADEVANPFESALSSLERFLKSSKTNNLEYKVFKSVWLDAPVVYVDWEACNAYANWLGMRLPWEAEFEYVMRSYFNSASETQSQNPEKYKDWDTFSLKNIVKDQEGISVRSEGTAIPTNDDLIEEERLLVRAFAEREIPNDLLGRVWEWMGEVWSSEWPPEGYLGPSEYDIGAAPFAPNGRRFPVLVGHGKSELKDALWRWRNTVKLTSRCVRGSSYLFTGEEKNSVQLSRRTPMPVMNVNHDIGFRCVADLRILLED